MQDRTRKRRTNFAGRENIGHENIERKSSTVMLRVKLQPSEIIIAGLVTKTNN